MDHYKLWNGIRQAMLITLIAGAVSSASAQIIFIQKVDTTSHSKKKSRIDFDLEFGSWHPLGNLQNTFGSGVSLAGSMGVPVAYRVRIDVGVQFNTPSNAERIDFQMQDSVVTLSGARTYLFLFGARATRQSRIGTQWSWEQSAGAGLGLISAFQPTIQHIGETTEYYRIVTLQLTAGTAIYRGLGERMALGFFVDYNLAPYAMFGKVEKGFGQSYVRTGMRVRLLQCPPMLVGADENGWFLPEERAG